MHRHLAALLLTLAGVPLTAAAEPAAAVPTAQAAAPVQTAPPAQVAAPAQQAVLVTGASSGIGRKITERLAADGYVVYAGARKDADLKALGAISNVQPLRLDVTNPADIAAAVALVEKGGKGLHGLVNNAGVAIAMPFADMKIDQYEQVMAVNATGPVRMTQAFLPLLSAHKGRIVNIGSISGVLANASLTAYAMSKHALEAFTDSLAAQLGPQGVEVSIVEPGNYNSDIGRNALRLMGEQAHPADPAMYRLMADRSRYKEPDEVAAAVEQALFEPQPGRRYMVVPNQDEAERTIRKQIQQLVELNEGQPYGYDREALVKMLDEALAKARPRTH